jgi:hypothetical protein
VVLSEPIKVLGYKVIEVLIKEEPGIVAIAIAIAFHILVQLSTRILLDLTIRGNP